MIIDEMIFGRRVGAGVEVRLAWLDEECSLLVREIIFNTL